MVYLKKRENDEHRKYLTTFTKDPDEWKKATPLYHLHPDMPPLLIYQGEKTYSFYHRRDRRIYQCFQGVRSEP